MRTTSILVLVAAIVLGLIAVAGVQMLLSAQRGGGQVAGVEVSTVVVARKQLEFGTELSADVLKEVEWPADSTPDGSFSRVDELIDGDRRVALRSIAVGEPVLRDRITGFGGRATLSQIIEEGFRAVAVRVTDVSGAGGFILPSDRVDVLSTISPTNSKLDTVTNILLEDIRVLAIDQEADNSKGGAIVAKAATLEVSPEDAQKIALASTIGTISLSLRNTKNDGDDGDNKNELKPIRYKDLGPAKPEKEKKARVYTPSPYTVMNVTRGTKKTRSSVVRESANRVRRNRTETLSTNTSSMRTGVASGTANVSSALKFTAPAGDE